MSILVNEISKTYGKQLALNNVSFQIGENQIVGFLGPNGAGKSTMMKILTCYLPQTSGTASVCGFSITENSMEVRKNIGYLPEHNPLYLEMYVKEFLEFTGGIYKIQNIKSRVKEMIHTTGLELEQNKKIGALSKGYRQRVGLAQALVHNPKVLILDEPTTGLDPNQIEEIRQLIKALGKEKTVMLSTHIMQEVEAICDRVIIINKGQIVANNDIKSLQQNTTQQIVTVEFDKAVSEDLLKTIPLIENAMQLSENTWQLSSYSNEDIRKKVFDFAISKQLTVLTLNKTEKKIESVFKELTKN
ncbi:MAG: gliding motility-associated ABC transporter ATP-binding subunit GldA [Bacteroidetes bacterium]|nr:gliding motility-associated ABC transporter ATP-binding subunit GldA [Bacteroidota bacterium]